MENFLCNGMGVFARKVQGVCKRSAVRGRESSLYCSNTVLHGNEHAKRANDTGHLLWGGGGGIKNKRYGG